MEIIIEIGTKEEKLLVQKELSAIAMVVKELEPPVPLNQIIVPLDFQAKINSLEGVDTYESVRGFGSNIIAVLAKIAKVGDGYAIVLSPSLYAEPYDIQTRLSIVLHELHHIINRRDFPPLPPRIPFVPSYCTQNLYFLYDEYSSDRFAYQLIDTLFPSKSSYRNTLLTSDALGFLELITDTKYYNHFQTEINAFKIHGDLDLFLKSTSIQYSEMATTLTHTFSLIHCYSELISHENLLKSHFVNEKTFSLMEYYRIKTEEKDVNLSDGMNLVVGFIENFGISFMQAGDEGRYRIIDI